ncbi:MAG: hypothetical protein KZQ91_05395 [Candidatus Thiodiazotropha sp. (ex Lucinoma borealis)]|nr:hypothetical protein [Candidatus Thiodiazotropha sp. (ex Lucinoma borealis)]
MNKRESYTVSTHDVGFVSKYLRVVVPVTILFSGCQSDSEERQSTIQSNSSTKTSEMEVAVRRHAQPVTVNYPETGVDVGWGWDSEEGIPQPNVCIEYSIEEDMGQTKYMTMTEVSDSRELMQSMNISAAASIKTIAYSASGSAKFAKNTKINSFSSNFVLNVSVDNGVRYATPLLPGSRGDIKDPETRKTLPDAGSIRLTSDALRLAKQRDLTDFLNLCGDSFVAALYGGARLTSVITVTSSSRKEKEQASAEFSGSGWGVNVKASASGSSEANIASNRVNMRFFQTGGRKDKIPASKGDLIEKLDSLTTEASDYPAYYRVTLMPYTVLSNWPEKSIQLDLSEQDQLADLWSRYAGLYEDIEYIFKHRQEFQILNSEMKFIPLQDEHIDSLEKLQDQVQAGLSRLQDEALRCSVPEELCEFDENLYLSPFAYFIQLPLPIDMTEKNKECPCADDSPKGERETNIAALVDYYIRNPVKNRCINNPVDRGCLSNARIDQWMNRVDKQLIELPDIEMAKKLIQHIGGQSDQTLAWLDVIDNPPHAWLDPSQIEEGKMPLDIVQALLE